MNSLFLVAKETYLRQVKSWSFVFMVFAPFIMIFFSLGIGYLTGSSMDQGGQEIALISQEASVQSAFEDLDGLTSDYTDEEAAKKALEDEDLLGYLIVTVSDGQLSAVYHGNELPSIETETAIQQTLAELQDQLNKEDAQLTSQQEATLARTPAYQVQLVENKGYEKIGKFILFFALIFLLYVLTMIYASTTAQEVASEKGTKIMEVIFSSVPASTYFYGRILGIFMVIATHLGIYALGGVGSYQFASLALLTMQDNPIAQAVLGGFDWFILFFSLFGLVLIVVIAALCGSLVVRQEDVNKAVPSHVPYYYWLYRGNDLGSAGSGVYLTQNRLLCATVIDLLHANSYHQRLGKWSGSRDFPPYPHCQHSSSDLLYRKILCGLDSANR